jgi:hypothetical protein
VRRGQRSSQGPWPRSRNGAIALQLRWNHQQRSCTYL